MKTLLTSFLLPPGICVLLALFALFFLLKKRQKLATIFVALTVSLGWMFSTEAFGRFMVAGVIAQVDARQANPENIDMIVVLGAGMENMGVAGWMPTQESYKRMAVALEIQNRIGSRVPILVSGGKTAGTKHPSEARVMMQQFDKRSAQITPMIAEEISTNTYENALQSAHVIRRRDAQNVLLVTSEEHMLRALAALVTAVFSALLDNVTTVLLTTPVLLLITRELGVRPYPYLFASIIASNIGGSSTLIGDPTTVMIGSAAHLSFNDFIVNVMPLSACLMILSLIPILFIWRKDLVATEHNKTRIMKLNEKEAIKDPALLKKSLVVLVSVISGFVIGHGMGVMPATIAMTGAATLLLLDNIKNDHEKQEHRVHHSIGEAEWITIFFFAGLFVVVHGLEAVGAIGFLADQLMAFTEGDFEKTAIAVLWGAAILSAAVDNIPFVATMIPMIESMSELDGFENLQPLWWALGLGACLGGSGSLIGSSANLVVAGFAARSGNAIGFFRYMLVAVPLMLVNVSLAHVYIYFRYLAE